MLSDKEKLIRVVKVVLVCKIYDYFLKIVILCYLIVFCIIN